MRLGKMLALSAAALTLALASCSTSTNPTPPAASVQSDGVWSFAFEAGTGVARAVLKGADGRAIVTVACQTPNGAMNIVDYTWERSAAQANLPATFSIGQASAAATARIATVMSTERNGLQLALPSNAPVFNALTPNASVKVATATRTHVWEGEAAVKINDVLNVCRQRGS